MSLASLDERSMIIGCVFGVLLVIAVGTVALCVAKHRRRVKGEEKRFSSREVVRIHDLGVPKLEHLCVSHCRSLGETLVPTGVSGSSAASKHDDKIHAVPIRRPTNSRFLVADTDGAKGGV